MFESVFRPATINDYSPNELSHLLGIASFTFETVPAFVEYLAEFPKGTPYPIILASLRELF